MTRPARGGEYPLQDGFGWTNGVLRRLLALYPSAIEGDDEQRLDAAARRCLDIDGDSQDEHEDSSGRCVARTERPDWACRSLAGTAPRSRRAISSSSSASPSTRSRRRAGRPTATCSCSAPRSSAPRSCRLAANSDDTRQISDVETLITNGVDVLVIVPHNGTPMARRVRMAHDGGHSRSSPTTASSATATSISTSASTTSSVGELQAQYLVDKLPTPGKGRIVRIYGSEDRQQRAAQFKQGQDNVLEPYIERGDIKVDPRGLGRGLEAGERASASSTPRITGARRRASTRSSPATTAPPAAPSRR